MIWKVTPYYAHIDYKGNKDPICTYIRVMGSPIRHDPTVNSLEKTSYVNRTLNPISSLGLSDDLLVEVEYRGRQSNVILTKQEESTLKIFR